MTESNENEPAVVIERRSGGGVGLFLLGVAVGAGLALLYAPQSGAQTRNELRRGARKLKRKAHDLAEDAKDAAADIVRDSRKAATGFVRTTRAAARDAAGEARDALERRLARHGRPAADEESEDTVV